MKCNCCPRQCNVDRTRRVGFCGVHERVKIARVMLHHYEEPIISGGENAVGSGAIFFAGCNLRCCYCQNYPISHELNGKYYSILELVNIMKELELKGALNINLVTPSHYAEQIIEALKIYTPNIPIIWNSSGYDSVETIQKLKPFIDIYLVDIKYATNELGVRYSKLADYVEINQKAIMEMRKNQPNDVIENGVMKRGVIVRHLVLPSHTDDSIKCLDFVCKNLGANTIVSIMSQYEPLYNAKNYTEINRKLKPIEYKRVVSHALQLNLVNAYIQDLSSANSKYIPDFNQK